MESFCLWHLDNIEFVLADDKSFAREAVYKHLHNRPARISLSSYLLESLIIDMAYKKIVISNGQNKGEKLTPEELNKLVRKDDFDRQKNLQRSQ